MSASRIYGVLWRWHFLAGLAACPIVLVALTGALYAFQPELDPLVDPDLLVVEPAPTRARFDDLVATAARSCTPRGIVLPSADERPAIVYCTGEPRREIFLDPYRGHVLGERVEGGSLFSVIFELHRDLLLGDPGRILVEWASAWTLLLLLSGAVLWWPRGKRRGGGVWWPRRGVSGRQWLCDLHAVIGAYTIPVLFAITASGLTWTLLAGHERWHPLTEDKIHDTWDHPPASKVIPGAKRIGFDAALAAARIDPATEPLAIYVDPPTKPDGSYAALVYDDRFESPWRGSSIWIDAYSGAELARLGWADRSTLGKLDSTMYSIHIGSLLGLPGRILACVAAVILALLCVTGPWMWWKRRPAGRLGAPPRASRRSWALLAVLAAFGWLLPTVGITLLAIANRGSSPSPRFESSAPPHAARRIAASAHASIRSCMAATRIRPRTEKKMKIVFNCSERRSLCTTRCSHLLSRAPLSRSSASRTYRQKRDSSGAIGVPSLRLRHHARQQRGSCAAQRAPHPRAHSDQPVHASREHVRALGI